MTSEGVAAAEGSATALVVGAGEPRRAGDLGVAAGAVSAPAISSDRIVMAMRRLRVRHSGVGLQAIIALTLALP